MDPRGLTTDPNREGQPLRWWEEIGASQKPSPYAEESWIVYQDTFVETAVIPNTAQTRKVTFGVVKVYDHYASHPNPSNIVNDADVIEEMSEPERGTPLGSLSYEIEGGLLTITDWSHYSWYDAAPVRKAFRALRGSIPECVTTMVVINDPTAFWTSLGFSLPFKGSDTLVYDISSFEPIPY